MARKSTTTKPSKSWKQPTEQDTLPTDALDETDPGDETQRNYRYQHAYGVILLVQAKLGQVQYVAIWCEHHEDFLCKRVDGRFDGWQIKTSTPENGPWRILDPRLVRSITRFCELVTDHDVHIADLFFASNVEVDSVTEASSDDKKRSGCPQLFLDHVRNCDDASDIEAPFKDSFESLLAQTGMEPGLLLTVLKKLKFVLGPSRNDFDAVVAHDHIAKLPECASCPPARISQIRDDLVEMVWNASSLKETNGTRHIRPIDARGELNTTLIAKRITVDQITLVIGANDASRRFEILRPASLKLGEPSSYPAGLALREKLKKGGLDNDQAEIFEVLALSTEYHLLQEAIRSPEDYKRIQADLESAVLLRCRQSYLRAKQSGEPFGEILMIDIQNQLRDLAENSPNQVWHQSYECLLGLAGLLTDECRVWFSKHFSIEEAAANLGAAS